MATVTFIPEKKQHLSAMRAVMRYCMQESKTHDPESGQRLISGVNCEGLNAETEFLATKAAYRKLDGMNFYQYVQSFSPAEEITPVQAHQIALEFAEEAWVGYEVLVCTHCDAAHIHSHFIINSVSYEHGKKLRQHPDTLKKLRSLSDELCRKHGLTQLKTYESGGQKLSAKEYRAAVKGQSWKFQLMFQIDNAMKLASSQAEFVQLLHRSGYDVVWKDERKDLTFICPDGKKCRSSRLHSKKYQKENLIDEFTLRKQFLTAYLAGNAGGTERLSPDQSGADTVSTHDLRSPRGVEESGVGAVAASSGVPTHPLRTDLGTDHQSRVGADADSTSTNRQQGSGADSETPRNPSETGWERERTAYLQALQHALGAKTGNADNARQLPKAAVPSDNLHRGDLGAGFGLALRGAAALGMIEGTAEDEEERRKRLEAEQNGSNLGTALGLAAGVLLSAGRSTQNHTEEQDVSPDDLNTGMTHQEGSL